MKSLKYICEHVVFNWIIALLKIKKKNLSHQWIMEMDNWIEAMELSNIKNYLQTYCIAPIFDSLLSKSVKVLFESRFHDLLSCCFHIFVTKSTLKLVIPECLKMDQTHRMHILKTVRNYTNIQKLFFDCYSGLTTYYVSEFEQKLLLDAIVNYSNLTLLNLPNVANDDIIQVLVNNCSKLIILMLSPNKDITDQSAQILSGIFYIIKKGPLIRIEQVGTPTLPTAIPLKSSSSMRATLVFNLFLNETMLVFNP
jgi:hypothetical protein